MNVNRFSVAQLGFNDDLHVVLANDNTIYQYEWDTIYPPTLVTKYGLMSGTKVEQLFVDYDFVIALTTAPFGEKVLRHTWVFSRRTASYTNAFGSF